MPSAGSRPRKRPPLDAFVSGPENEVAWSAVQHLIDDPGYLPGPVVLHGPAGSGKTHLLDGMSRELRRKHPTLEQRHFTARRLARAFQAAHQRRQPQALAAELSALDLLLLDGLEGLSTSKATQKMLSRTLETIREQGGQAILTSRAAPRTIVGLNPDLASRLHQGVLIRVDPAGPASRLALLRRELTARQVSLARPLQEQIASRVEDPHQLVAILDLLTHLAQKGQPLRRPLIEELLARHAGEQAAGGLDAICALVERHRGLEPKSLSEPGGPRPRAAARRLALLLADGHSRAELADYFQLKPGSVSAALRKARQELETDPALARELEQLRRKL